LVIFNLIENYEVFSNFPGITYQGIKLNVRSTCIIFIFSLISLDAKYNKYSINFIAIITKYTGGIYYIHEIVRNNLKSIFYDIKTGTFIGLILIYLFSYLICYLGTLIFRKTKIKYLFC